MLSGGTSTAFPQHHTSASRCHLPAPSGNAIRGLAKLRRMLLRPSIEDSQKKRAFWRVVCQTLTMHSPSGRWHLAGPLIRGLDNPPEARHPDERVG